MLEPLNRLEGESRWAIPVAVYGNRSPETCVEEMAGILRGRGFRVLAAASFVAEHSVSSPQYPIAPGRPDREDLEKAARFGEQVRLKISDPFEIQVSTRLKNFLTNEMVDSLPDGYHRKAIDTIKDLVWVVFHDDAECIMCKNCEQVCPTSAMDIGSREVDDDLCIRCMACARACPEGVAGKSPMKDTKPARIEALDKLSGARNESKTYL